MSISYSGIAQLTALLFVNGESPFTSMLLLTLSQAWRAHWALVTDRTSSLFQTQG